MFVIPGWLEAAKCVVSYQFFLNRLLRSAVRLWQTSELVTLE